MAKKVNTPKTTKGYVYVGTWGDNELLYPFHQISDSKKSATVACIGRVSGKSLEDLYKLDDKRFFLCEISIKPLKDVKNRPITRKLKNIKVTENK